MKTQIKEKSQAIIKIINDKKSLYLIFKILACFGTGILSSTPYVYGSFSPLCVALPSSFNGAYSVACAIGSILGIFVFQSGLCAFRNFATVITSVVLLQIFVNYFDVSRKALIKILCPTFCALSVNGIFLFSQRITAELLVSNIFEIGIISVCVPIFSTANQLISKKVNINLLQDKEIFSLLIFINLLAGQVLFFGDIGKGICTGFFIGEILIFSYQKLSKLSVISASISCIAFAFSQEADFMCAVFPICCVLLTIFKSRQKYVGAVICFAVSLLGSVLGEYTDILSTVTSVLAAGIIFVLLPKKFIKIQEESAVSFEPNPIAIPLQAKEISSAVENLGDCITAVRKAIKPISNLSLRDTIFLSVQRACDKCEIKDSCINSIRKKESEIYSHIEKAIKENNLSYSIFPENFKNACYESDEIFSAIKQGFFLYNSQKNSQNKIQKFQELTGNQFKTFGSILDGICTTAVNCGAVTSRYSPECESCGEELGIKVKSARLCTNKAGQDYYNLSFEKPDENFNVTLLHSLMCKSTLTKLNFPTLIQKDNIYSLIFKQKEKVSFKISAATRPADANGVSGDYYRSFCDGFSRQNIILSDGMGTGSRAAVDSAFTCETLCNLLKAGLDVKTAISTVNCATLIKSVDESLATVDFLIADPILSKVQIYKCGAAPTFILKQGKASVLEPQSTPIGILQDVDMSRSEFSVDAGDIILTVSDGITEDNWNWITIELKARHFDNPTALAKHILQCALDRKGVRRPDDMTVIAIMVEKA